jgi:thiamine biosynthesis protein ThiS
VTTREKGFSAEAGVIRVRVNGEDRSLAEGTTVHGLLDELELAAGLVVVEHNREILDRGAYGDVVLEDGDRVELVHFVGGG